MNIKNTVLLIESIVLLIESIVLLIESIVLLIESIVLLIESIVLALYCYTCNILVNPSLHHQIFSLAILCILTGVDFI